MAKWMQNQKEEERFVSKSRPAAMTVSSSIATSSSSASSPIASKSPEMPMASGKPDSRMRIETSSFDAASTCQVRLKDAYFGGLMEKQRRKLWHQEEQDSEDCDNPEAEIWYYKGKQVTEETVAQNSEAWCNPLHPEPVLHLTSQENMIATRRHYLQISQHPSHLMKPSSPWSGKCMEDNVAIP